MQYRKIHEIIHYKHIKNDIASKYRLQNNLSIL